MTKQFTQLREEINQSSSELGSVVKRQEAETAVAEADSDLARRGRRFDESVASVAASAGSSFGASPILAANAACVHHPFSLRSSRAEEGGLLCRSDESQSWTPPHPPPTSSLAVGSAERSHPGAMDDEDAKAFEEARRKATEATAERLRAAAQQSEAVAKARVAAASDRKAWSDVQTVRVLFLSVFSIVHCAHFTLAQGSEISLHSLRSPPAEPAIDHSLRSPADDC